MKKLLLALVILGTTIAPQAQELVGSVKSTWKDSLEVHRYDDPKIEGVSIYFSRPNAFGWGEDPSKFSIAVRATGPIKVVGELPDKEELTSSRASIFFKSFKVVRFHDAAKNTVVYLVFSKKLIDGSPNSSISAVVLPSDE